MQTAITPLKEDSDYLKNGPCLNEKMIVFYCEILLLWKMNVTEGDV